jgi:hypothetical protein
MNSRWAVVFALFAFYASYLLAWMVLLTLNVYPNPAWGGEAVLSFYFLMMITLPDALMIVILRKQTGPFASAILGVVALLTVVPKIAFVKYLLQVFGWDSYAGLIVIFAATEATVAYLILRIVGSGIRSQSSPDHGSR